MYTCAPSECLWVSEKGVRSCGTGFTGDVGTVNGTWVFCKNNKYLFGKFKGMAPALLYFW